MDTGDTEELFMIEGMGIDMKKLDEDFDAWVHTERPICITHCAPDSNMARRMKMTDQVYPITRYVRGRALIISNASYQALRMLKDIFTQMNYVTKIETGKSDSQIRRIVETEARNEDNQYVDSFIVVIYGTPDGFSYGYLPQTLNDDNAPVLKGKPKLIYVIGDTDITHQLTDARYDYPDMFSASTGFSGVMFYMYILARFAHELSAQSIWKLLVRYATDHRFVAATQDTMRKQFYFFPGLTTSVFPAEIEKLDQADMVLYRKMLDEGSVQMYNIRLMFVGLFGAGKTSTARRIMQQPTDDVHSTDGIDVQIGRCKIEIRNRKWKTVTDESESVSNTQLRKLQFLDRKSTGNIPDIKSLENVSVKMEQENDINAHAGPLHDDLSNRKTEARVKRQVFGKRSGSTGKRSWSEASEEDDDNYSLSSSQSSVATGFELLKIRSDSTDSEDFEMVLGDKNESSGSANSAASARRARGVFEAPMSDRTGVEYEEASVSLWDFAGQFVYYATHQLFFSPRSVYLLVVNLEDNLEKTLTDWFMDIRGKQSIDEKGGINFWLRSIYAYSRGNSSGVPPIILVGTHGDKLVGSPEERKKTANAYFKRIRNTFLSTPLINNICPRGFLLNNTRPDDTEINSLKDYILQIAETMPYWGEEIPAKWLELDLAIEEERMQNRHFITMTQLEQIVNTLASPFSDKDKLGLFLKAHHETGSFVYFGESDKLRHVIVLEPQWIINAFRSLIAATDFAHKYGKLQAQWEEFNETGRLHSKLAKHIWELDEDSTFYENSDLLLHFLEELDIIGQPAVLNEDQTKIRRLEFHYVPCMLKETAPEDVIPRRQQQNTLSTPVLCLSFKENFMPPAVFYSIISLCMKKWPVARNGRKMLMFCGCAVFEIRYGRGQDLHRLYVFCRQSKIGIRITRYTTQHATMVDPNICDEVRRFITSAVKKEFQRFEDFGTISEDLPFIYQLQCKQTVEDDVMDEGLHNKEDLVKAIGTDFFCNEHSAEFNPHSLRPVEVLHEWFNDEIPKNFRFDSYSASVIDTWTSKLPDNLKSVAVTERMLSRLSNAVGRHWRKLMEQQLGLKKVIIDQIEEDSPQNARLQILNCLLAWKGDCDKKIPTEATNGTILEALKTAQSRGVQVDFEEVQNVFDNVMH